MRKIYAFFLILSFSLMQSQVGINTVDPQATLDVNGNVIIRTVDAASSSSNYDFLVHNNSTNEVQKVNGNLASSSPQKTIAKGVTKNGVSLLSGTLFAGWQKIKFASGNVPINQGTQVVGVSSSTLEQSSGQRGLAESRSI